MEKAAGSHNSHSKSSGGGVCVIVHPCPNSMSLLVYDGMDKFVFMCIQACLFNPFFTEGVCEGCVCKKMYFSIRSQSCKQRGTITVNGFLGCLCGFTKTDMIDVLF